MHQVHCKGKPAQLLQDGPLSGDIPPEIHAAPKDQKRKRRRHRMVVRHDQSVFSRQPPIYGSRRKQEGKYAQAPHCPYLPGSMTPPFLGRSPFFFPSRWGTAGLCGKQISAYIIEEIDSLLRQLVTPSQSQHPAQTRQPAADCKKQTLHQIYPPYGNPCQKPPECRSEQVKEQNSIQIPHVGPALPPKHHQDSSAHHVKAETPLRGHLFQQSKRHSEHKQSQ